MIQVNLHEFWHVSIGSEMHLFASEKEANAFASEQNDEAKADFDRWVAGDREVSDAIAVSTLEADVDGRPSQSFSINPCVFARVVHHPPFTTSQHCWEDEPGVDRIRWGNPATARPKSAVSVA